MVQCTGDIPGSQYENNVARYISARYISARYIASALYIFLYLYQIVYYIISYHITTYHMKSCHTIRNNMMQYDMYHMILYDVMCFDLMWYDKKYDINITMIYGARAMYRAILFSYIVSALHFQQNNSVRKIGDSYKIYFENNAVRSSQVRSYIIILVQWKNEIQYKINIKKIHKIIRFLFFISVLRVFFFFYRWTRYHYSPQGTYITYATVAEVSCGRPVPNTIYKIFKILLWSQY